MAQSYQAIRGMNDMLPEAAPYWRAVEEACRDLARRYSYQEIRLPILEQTALFKRTIGQATDIIEKEMYTFEDRNGDSLSLRPEGTAGCVRAGIERGILYNQIRRLWYLGPMFRHERPQRGRYRQFYQFGLEAFGMKGPDIDAEQIIFCKRLWEQLGIANHVKLEINSLGTSETRAAYRDALVAYLEKNKNVLDEDSQRRLHTNPLRVLDSKNPSMQDLIHHAPKLTEFLDAASKEHFEGLLGFLDAAGVAYTINPRLVRGLDYYGLTVYEWVTDMLGAQGTVCAGGRYDVLVEQLGGKVTPAVGFAMGIERLVLMLQEQGEHAFTPDICFVLLGDAAVTRGMVLAEQLRHDFPSLIIETNLSAGSFKSQFKRADKSGARWAFIIADDELQSNQVSIKDLRGDAPQQSFSIDGLKDFLQEYRGADHE